MKSKFLRGKFSKVVKKYRINRNKSFQFFSHHSTMEACEDDKATKDSQIRTLKEEISHQEELIGKLGKEKRSVGDTRQKTEEDIQAMEDKCNHLNKLKAKLEQALDECEDSLERE